MASGSRYVFLAPRITVAFAHRRKPQTALRYAATADVGSGFPSSFYTSEFVGDAAFLAAMNSRRKHAWTIAYAAVQCGMNAWTRRVDFQR